MDVDSLASAVVSAVEREICGLAEPREVYTAIAGQFSARAAAQAPTNPPAQSDTSVSREASGVPPEEDGLYTDRPKRSPAAIRAFADTVGRYRRRHDEQVYTDEELDRI